MRNTLNAQIAQLTKLVEQSRNKRLLWEEMQLISQKAFELQDKIMAELDQTEALETDIIKVQAAFSARESIWDLMDRITTREQELKARTHHRETPAEREKRHREVMADATKHTCCCGHHTHGDNCCGKHSEKCCCHTQKTGKVSAPKRRKVCRKK